MTSRPKRFTSS